MCLLQQHAQVFVIKHTLLASDNKRSQFLFLEKSGSIKRLIWFHVLQN
jgi:hypothetical protein